MYRYPLAKLQLQLGGWRLWPSRSRKNCFLYHKYRYIHLQIRRINGTISYTLPCTYHMYSTSMYRCISFGRYNIREIYGDSAGYLHRLSGKVVVTGVSPTARCLPSWLLRASFSIVDLHRISPTPALALSATDDHSQQTRNKVPRTKRTSRDANPSATAGKDDKSLLLTLFNLTYVINKDEVRQNIRSHSWSVL